MLAIQMYQYFITREFYRNFLLSTTGIDFFAYSPPPPRLLKKVGTHFGFTGWLYNQFLWSGLFVEDELWLAGSFPNACFNAAFDVEFLKKDMLETSNLASSDLASSLEDSMSSLEDGLLRDLQRHVVVKGRDARDERPGLELGRFHVWPRGLAPYRSTKTCCFEGQRCWR
jgi:hypothetical protein